MKFVKNPLFQSNPNESRCAGEEDEDPSSDFRKYLILRTDPTSPSVEAAASRSGGLQTAEPITKAVSNRRSLLLTFAKSLSR